jgi:hypothetical protein
MIGGASAMSKGDHHGIPLRDLLSFQNLAVKRWNMELPKRV